MNLQKDRSLSRSRPSRRTRPKVFASIAFLVLVVSAAWATPLTGVVSESSDAAAAQLGWIPIITIHPPLVTIFPIDPLLIVNVPDANLNAALHTRCGILSTEPLRRGDLYALTGSLNLTGRDIANLEGVQYCRQIHVLNASENPLSALPDMSAMAGLQQLYLDDCDFGAIPAEVGLIPNLVVLVASRNRLTDLPGFIATLPELKVLYVNGNEIREIPASYGSGNLEALFVQQNRLTSLPDELVGSPHLKTLYAGLNRLSRLPSSLSGKSWHELDFEFNFLDVSSGGDARVLLESLSTSECRFERQLTPIQGLSAEATPDSIRLNWTSCPDTDTGSYSSKVTRYLVYLNEGGVLTELAILDKSTQEFSDTGLASATERTYTVGVEYSVVDSLQSGITRHYVSLTTSTKDPTTTIEPSATSPASLTPALSPTSGPSPVQPSVSPSVPTEAVSPKPQGGGLLSWVPGWVLLLIGVIGLGVVVGASLLVVHAKKRR